MRTLTLKRGMFSAVVYTPDGGTLISLDSRSQVRFWDLATFTQRLSFTLPRGFGGREGRLQLAGGLLITNNGAFEIADLLERMKHSSPSPGVTTDPPPSLALDGDEPATLTATPDGRLLAGVKVDVLYPTLSPTRNFVWTSHVRLWDRRGQFLRVIDIDGQLFGTALSPDGRTFAGCWNRFMGDPVGVRLCDLESGTDIGQLCCSCMPREVLFSADGRRLAVGAGRSVWLWDVAERRPLTRLLPSFRGALQCLALHPTRRLVAAGGRDGVIRIWDLDNYREVACYNWEVGAIHGLAFSPDGTTAAAAGHDSALVVWDVE